MNTLWLIIIIISRWIDMDKLGKVEEQLNNVKEKLNNVEEKVKETEETNFATKALNKLIKIIIYLIIFIFINNAIWIVGTFWYNSLPVEETEIIQDGDTEGDNSPINQQIGE